MACVEVLRGDNQMQNSDLGSGPLPCELYGVLYLVYTVRCGSAQFDDSATSPCSTIRTTLLLISATWIRDRVLSFCKRLNLAVSFTHPPTTNTHQRCCATPLLLPPPSACVVMTAVLRTGPSLTLSMHDEVSVGHTLYWGGPIVRLGCTGRPSPPLHDCA